MRPHRVTSSPNVTHLTDRKRDKQSLVYRELKHIKERWEEAGNPEFNCIRWQIYEVMFSWEICPQSTSWMIVLKSTVNPTFNILMAE